jgi:hypothetical protein
MPAAERLAKGRNNRRDKRRDTGRAEPRAKRPLLQFVLFGVLVAGALIAVRAEPKAEPAPSEAGLVLSADESLGESLRAGDKSIARKLLSLQFTYTDENGAIHARKEFLTDLKGAAAAPMTDAKAAVYGSIAMITGHLKAAPDGDTFVLHIWAKQKGAWRILTMQDVALGATDPAAGQPEVPGVDAGRYECKNPCQTIPYRVRSPAEQDVINVYQTIEKSVVAHDADEWRKHVGDEFVHYRSGQTPISKPARIAMIEDEKEKKIPAILGAVQSMRLWVYGDGAAMISTNGVGDESEPLMRVVRVWAKRGGQWQMAISVQTLVK